MSEPISCPTCKVTMLERAGVVIFWCPACGTIKSRFGEPSVPSWIRQVDEYGNALVRRLTEPYALEGEEQK